MNIYIGLFLSALTGVLLALSGIYSGLFAWIAFVPVCIALEGASLKRGFLYGAVGGACAGALLFYGVMLYGVKYYLALIAYNALQGALSAATYAELLKRTKNALLNIFAPPLAWILFEYLKTVGQVSFPMPLGSSQHAFLPLLQVSSIAGVYGISLIILWVNRVAAIWITRFLADKGAGGISVVGPRPALLATAAVTALLITAVGWGTYILKKNPADTTRGIKTAVL
ncbi:MAG: hypothetical protein HY589_04875, partial [Candidatus Omnitrophica bacterium]|nr:hypothetical protein [Candidatus Omnitrophota bacterium]